MISLNTFKTISTFSLIFNVLFFSLALNDNMPHVGKSPVRIRFQSVLSALITQTAYYKELLKSVADESVTEDSFEWQKLLKYAFFEC